MSRFLRSTLAVAVVAAAFAAGASAAAPVETVLFKPVAKSGVAGSATVGANGIGTKISVRLKGLAPGAKATVLLRVGRYPKLSASFAKGVVATADARGVARASSAIRYRSEPVSFSVVADGDHVLTVIVGGRVVAYAEIPGMS
jgi:opacity protein-like surface antigen